MVSRRILQIFSASFLVFLFCSAAQGQKALRNDDISVGGFYQFTSDASGNGITGSHGKGKITLAWEDHSASVPLLAH
jgi:hypothetical protein